MTAQQVADAARLLAFALQPRAYAAQSGAYSELLGRYRTDAELRTAFHAIVNGLDLKVLEDTPRALLLGSGRESVFAFRLSEYRKAGPLEQRVIRGLILLAIAAYCYPTRRQLEETRMPVFSAKQVDEFLRAACEQLRTEAGGDAPVPEDPDLAMAWQVYLRQPAVKAAERRTQSATVHLIERALEDMVEWGLVKEEPEVDRVRHFRALPRFRAQARELGSRYGLAELARIRAQQSGGEAP